MLNAFKKKDNIKQSNVDMNEETDGDKNIKYRKKAEETSIYKIILDNVDSDGTLKVQRIEEELWKTENNPNTPIYMAGYKDNLKIEPKEISEVTGMLMLEKLGKGMYKKISTFESEFLKLDITAKEFLNFFHTNISKIKPDLKAVHDFMVKVFTNTLNMEVFKVAFEIVGMFSDESGEKTIFIIGQYPELTRYMTMILFNKGEMDKIPELLSRTEGWGKVAILELLAYNDLIKDKLDYQIEVIKATYSGKFVLSTETDPIIAHNLNISKILDRSLDDEKLFLELTNIINISIEGGVYTSLLNTPDGREKFLKYIHTLKEIDYPQEKLVGYIILYRTFKYVPDELMEQILGKEFDYSELKNEIKAYLDKNFKKEAVSEIFQSENEFFLLDYAIDNRKTFVLDIVKRKYSGDIYNYNYLNLVFEIGTKKAKEEVLERFHKDFDIQSRQNEKFSMESNPEWANDERYKYDSILGMILANFHRLTDKAEYIDIEYGLFDFNPQIRHAALIALLSIENYEMNMEIARQVKRLLIETPHVRGAAAEVMKVYGLNLSQNEYNEILGKLGEKIQSDEIVKLKEFVI